MVSGVCMMYVGLTCNAGHHGLCCMHTWDLRAM